MLVYFMHVSVIDSLCKQWNVEEYWSERTIQRLKKASNSLRRKHILGGELLFNYVLNAHQISRNSIHISTNKYGKKLLNKGYYNLSHSKDWMMCVYHTASIGVDIERVTQVNLPLAKYFFTEKEFDYLRQLPVGRKAEYFFNTWTLKESYTKCIGTSIFHIKGVINTPKDLRYFKRNSIFINNQLYYFIRGKLDDYVWCVLSENLPTNVTTKVVGLEEVMDFFEK